MIYDKRMTASEAIAAEKGKAISETKRRCWNCKRIFAGEEIGLHYCPTCSAITSGIDTIEEKPETLQQETTCLDKFCKARIPGEGQSVHKGYAASPSGPLPMNPAQLAAQAEAERGRSSLQRIFQLLSDSCDLLYNARQLLLEADREVSRMQGQPTPPRSDMQ